MIPRLLLLALLGALHGAFLSPPLAADNWPQWRGPTADGHSAEQNLPRRWSPTENVLWRVPLEGVGTSTPIVWNERIFVTSQLGDGPISGRSNDFEGAQSQRRMKVEDGVRFVVQAFDRADGGLLWERGFAAGDDLPEVHVKHNLASPSCVTDGENLYAWFGTGLTVALTLDGEELWRRHLGRDFTRFDVRWGHGSSPALYNDSLLLLVDHPLRSYLLAVDKRTGEQQWLSDRGTGKRSYTTPFVIEREQGDQLIVNTNDAIEALDPQTGEPLWQVGQPNRVPVGMPVFHNETLYSNRGYGSGPYLAVGVDGTGAVDDTELRWRVPTGAPYVGSVVYANGLLFMATERGIASAVDAETGDTLWKQRLGGVFTASPVTAEGYVYLVEESGKTFVLEANREFKQVAVNDLAERSLASPAISAGVIFLRTDDHLYAVGSE